MKCLLIGDEPKALEILRRYVERTHFLELAGSFRDPVRALEYMAANPVDLVFLDVNMPDMSGIQFLNALHARPLVIFTTAYSDYAVRSYEYDAVDYLLKPLEFERFARAAAKALELHRQREGNGPDRHTVAVEPGPGRYLVIKSGTDYHKLQFDEILYIEAAGNYAVFVTPSAKVMSLQRPDGTGVFWSAMLEEGSEQAIFCSTFDGKTLSRPQLTPFAAASANGGPAFSVDGRHLFFNARLPAAEASPARPTAICYVERSGSVWNSPVPIESTIDTRMTKGQVSVARNGNVYFSGRVLTEKMPAIYVCRYSSGKYLAPERLGGPLAAEYLLVDPWVDPDENYLLVTCSPLEGAPMPFDIGLSIRQEDGNWGRPIRLGGAVNTPAYERFSSISGDGKYFFFIRSYREGFVGDQAHFYWADASILDGLRIKAKDSKAE